MSWSLVFFSVAVSLALFGLFKYGFQYLVERLHVKTAAAFIDKDAIMARVDKKIDEVFYAMEVDSDGEIRGADTVEEAGNADHAEPPANR